jgi:hypothetical protein
MRLITGDALSVLRELPSDSFDGMLTDPPYGIRLMELAWDDSMPSVSVWREALRVLKPGAFALIACATRTQHRMISRVEHAGFEIRDVIGWVYGGGFPKGRDISRALDKQAGAERVKVGEGKGRTGKASAGEGMYVTEGYGWDGSFDITEPATLNAQRWRDYDTVLKPAMEFWTLARKTPARGTIVNNVLKHDVGGLNIGGSRVPPEPHEVLPASKYGGGRWPSNVLLDGSPEVTALFPVGERGSAARLFWSPKASSEERGSGNNHPAVKPLALLRYLSALILPPNDVPRSLLVPFSGSGSEMIAAKQTGWVDVVGIEANPYFVAIAEQRFQRHLV